MQRFQSESSSSLIGASEGGLAGSSFFGGGELEGDLAFFFFSVFSFLFLFSGDALLDLFDFFFVEFVSGDALRSFFLSLSLLLLSRFGLLAFLEERSGEREEDLDSDLLDFRLELSESRLLSLFLSLESDLDLDLLDLSLLCLGERDLDLLLRSLLLFLSLLGLLLLERERDLLLRDVLPSREPLLFQALEGDLLAH
eukprot:CAMPEP_0168568928 /NCGR_PEP_ID=MMETSP0413-20121227/15851_1 /TAXON_ID=136452 /ORGANISM="Filamoeba nolandi, Strain NC-AS-23-1" /LENGTH=196 /DNA_ID=CAMNT_0008601321 /DNA_START=92 /DNA_END=682 /DNA_ORIENTATION=-